VKTLAMIPTREETETFLHSCVEHKLEPLDVNVGRLPGVRFPEIDLTVVRGGLGKVQFAVQTQHVLDLDRTWDVMICAGAAGALVAGLAVGDVVVATETVEHDVRNRFGPPRLPRFSGAATIIASLRAVRLPPSTFHLHFGAIASGDEDVIAVDRQDELRLLTGAVAVAWEGAGGARASQFSGVPFVEIRGITDSADSSAATDFAANLEVAMRNVVAVIVAWRRAQHG
jgi:adenosylhomocysteine nucleosidase